MLTAVFTNMALRAALKSSAGVLRESGALCSALSPKPWTCSSALLSGPRVSCGKWQRQEEEPSEAEQKKKEEIAS